MSDPIVINLVDTSAENAAKTFYGWLCNQAKLLGYDPDKEVHLFDPEQDKDYTGNDRGVWRVVWESGPFEWAIHLLGEESMYYGEIPEGGPGDPQVVFKDGDGYHVDCHYSFDIGFFSA